MVSLVKGMAVKKKRRKKEKRERERERERESLEVVTKQVSYEGVFYVILSSNNNTICKAQNLVHRDCSKCIHMHACTCTHTHTRAYMHAHKRWNTHTQTHTHTHTHIHTQTCAHTYTNVHTRTHARMYTHTHTHTKTTTHTQQSPSAGWVNLRPAGSKCCSLLQGEPAAPWWCLHCREPNRRSWLAPFRMTSWRSSWWGTPTSSLRSLPWKSLGTSLSTHLRWAACKFCVTIVYSFGEHVTVTIVYGYTALY